MGPQACIHVRDEMFLVVAFVDGASEVVEFLFVNCKEDHAFAMVVFRRICLRRDSATL